MFFFFFLSGTQSGPPDGDGAENKRTSVRVSSALSATFRSAPLRFQHLQLSSAQLRPLTKQPPSGTRVVCVWCHSEASLPQHHLVNKSATYPGMQRGAVKHRHDAPRPPPFRKGQKYIDSKRAREIFNLRMFLP